ncbi:MAG: ATP-dependent DNA helicase [Bacteroidia bacterium]|nr:ATP-dependent DNA helicase [Bacteroidia bacterium]
MKALSFEIELAKLNPKQREAVDSLEGPVMVIAGPGTGKTQILAMRIANILRNAHVEPHNILCLTYTDAGTIAMRERLRYLIGEAADRIKIATFHAFCNEIIFNNLDVFTDFENKKLLDELTQIKILRQIIDELPPNHPVKSPNAPYANLKRLRELIEILIKEGISLPELKDAISEEKENAKDYEKFKYQKNTRNNKKGDLKTGDYQDYCQKLDRTYQVAECITRYQELLKENNLYTFDDMIEQVLCVFKENPAFLQKYQEQFIYILVDEYQDTSSSQQKILCFLTEPWGIEANIFVVGDEDQSIFRFQGANMLNITEFIKRYEDKLKVIVLQDNYRSTQSILNASYKIVESNQERLEKQNKQFQKKLLAKNQPVDIKPTLIELDNSRLETAFILYEIQRIKQEIPNTQLSEIAVLAPKNDLLTPIARILKQNQIPYQIRRDINILEHYFIKHILNILYYLSPALKGLNTREDLLFQILMNPLWRLDWVDVQKLCFTKHKSIEYDSNSITPWVEYLNTPELLQGLGIREYKKMHEVFEKIKYWKWLALAVPVIEVVQTIIYEGGFVSYAAQHTEKEELLLVLDTLLNYVQTWVERNPKKGFSDLMQDIKEHQDFDVPIRILRWLGSEKGIFLSTYHSAKGLEFEHVYLINCDENAWNAAKNPPYTLPPVFIRKIDLQDTKKVLEDQRRLFFVGMTRAKKYLNLVFPKNNKNQRVQAPNSYYEELSKHHDLVEKKTVDLPTQTILGQIAQQFKGSTLPEPNLSIDENIIRFYQQRFTFSASHLNTYLDCKRKFYYRHILRIPDAPHHATVYGNAIHTACKEFFAVPHHERQSNHKQDYLLQAFEKALLAQKFMLTEQEYKDRLEQGKIELKSFYEHYLSQWQKADKILPEQRLQLPFKADNVDIQTTLVGIIDALIYLGNETLLIDYKTGRPDKIGDKVKPYEGDYWWQMLFYTYLAKKNNYPIQKAKLYFFSESNQGNSKEREIALQDEHEAELIRQINVTLEGIQKGNFERVDILEVDKKCKDCSFYGLCWKEENIRLES